MQVKSQPDEDNSGMLKRALKNLNGMKYLKLNVSVLDLGLLKWHMNKLDNMHWDCKGHAGVMVMMGKE
jgi:hypothetical protein